MGRRKRKGNGDEGELKESGGDSSEKRTRGGNSEENAVERRVTRHFVKSQMSEYGNRTAHPLLIDHILDKVFEYVVWNDEDTRKRAKKRRSGSNAATSGVQNVRLVCKLWKDRATLPFRDVRPASAFGFSWTKPNLVLERFLEVMQDSSMMPVQRYILGPTLFTEEKLILLENFFKICGPTAVEIKLLYNNFSSEMPVMLRTNLGFSDNSLIPDLGKLKTLEVQDLMMIDLVDEPTQYPLMNLTCVILESAPNLKKFSLKADVRKWDQDDEETHQVRKGRAKESLIEVLRRVPASVKTLQLNSALLSDLHWNTLAGIENLALSEFEFDFHPNALSSTAVIRNFLDHRAISVKKLVLSENFPLTPDTIPPLTDLLQIDLDLTALDPLPTILIPNYFPNLCVLNLRRIWNYNADPLFEWLSSHKCPSVKKLVLPRYFRVENVQNCVPRIARSFPNLEVLHLLSSWETEAAIRGIFTHLPGIQELTLETHTNISFNWLLSGISQEEYRRIFRGGKKLFGSLNLEVIQSNPSILSLTELRKLVIKGWPGPWPLTNFLVHAVISKMDNLEELRVPAATITPSSEKLLRDKLKVLEINTATVYH